MPLSAVIQNIGTIAAAIYLTLHGHWGIAIVVVMVFGLTPKSKNDVE